MKVWAVVRWASFRTPVRSRSVQLRSSRSRAPTALACGPCSSARVASRLARLAQVTVRVQVSEPSQLLRLFALQQVLLTAQASVMGCLCWQTTARRTPGHALIGSGFRASRADEVWLEAFAGGSECREGGSSGASTLQHQVQVNTHKQLGTRTKPKQNRVEIFTGLCNCMQFWQMGVYG